MHTRSSLPGAGTNTNAVTNAGTNTNPNTNTNAGANIGGGANTNTNTGTGRHSRRKVLGIVTAVTTVIAALSLAPAAGAATPQPVDGANATAKSVPYKFDLQPAGSPVAAGFTEATRSMVYSADRGWGFTTSDGLADRDRGSAAGANDLQRDFILGNAEFKIDVPNGSYSVTTHSGDWIGSSRTDFTIEGKKVSSGNAAKGEVAITVTSPVDVTDGQLTIADSGASARFNGIEITPLNTAPSNLKTTGISIAADDSSAVSLAWSQTGVEPSASYRIFRANAEGGASAPIGVSDEKKFVDTTAELGSDYDYTVTSIDSGGSESPSSKALRVSVVDPSVATVAAPRAVIIEGTEKKSVSLAWTPVDGAKKYVVYRSEKKDSGFAPLGRTADSRYVDNGVLTTVPFYYRVASVNNGGISDPSPIIATTVITSLVRQAEYLDRSPVAVKTSAGVYIGWRMLGTDPTTIAFNVYRDGTKITPSPLTGSTNLVDSAGTDASRYTVSRVLDNVETPVTAAFGVWNSGHLSIPLDKPADAVTPDGKSYSYSAGDASVGDFDGDGTYEIVLLWSPSNSKDNSQSGYTGIVYVDAYRLDGTKLWRINLGPNIRAGAHYTQVQVFDYDGDGKAEVIMKTAPGTIDGTGVRIGDTADYRTSAGYILSGPEYLTLFEGETGKALDTVAYDPPRGDVAAWGDSYGNRVDRFLAGTAYFDGEHPSVFFSRGYYTRIVIAAWDVVNSHLVKRWVFDTNSPQYGSAFEGQGDHNLGVADVDGDQKDEIVFGSLTIDDNGTPLYNTGLGHGDAIHVGDFDPSRPGLEVLAAHEDMGRSGNLGATYRDAKAGTVFSSIPATGDTGRAEIADIDPTHAGAEYWAIGGDRSWNSPRGQLMASDGTLIGTAIPAANFTAWWDGDLLREIVDHDWDAATNQGIPTISKWNWKTNTSEEIFRDDTARSDNGTKGTPTLQADLFGDWREELVWRSDDSTELRINTTTDVTTTRLSTLMHDPVYRLGVAWQNTSYNQPPEVSYFLGTGMTAPAAPRIAYADPHLSADGASAAPAKAALSTSVAKGTLVNDGDYSVTMKLDSGENAGVFRLYENGALAATRSLASNSPATQSAVIAFSSKPNGTYQYTGELENSKGVTSTAKLTIVIKSAAPGTPVLVSDNADGDGKYTVVSTMPVGTNATRWMLYENDRLLDAGVFAASTPKTQLTSTGVTGRTPGTYNYRMDYVNLAGVTSSSLLKTVVVR